MLVCLCKLCRKNKTNGEKLIEKNKTSWVLVSPMLQEYRFIFPLLVSFGARMHRITPLIALVPSPSAWTREIKKKKVAHYLPPLKPCQNIVLAVKQRSAECRAINHNVNGTRAEL